MGRPRSTIKTGEPPLRPSIKALSLFLASVRLTFFIRLESLSPLSYSSVLDP